MGSRPGGVLRGLTLAPLIPCRVLQPGWGVGVRGSRGRFGFRCCDAPRPHARGENLCGQWEPLGPHPRGEVGSQRFGTLGCLGGPGEPEVRGEPSTAAAAAGGFVAAPFLCRTQLSGLGAAAGELAWDRLGSALQHEGCRLRRLQIADGFAPCSQSRGAEPRPAVARVLRSLSPRAFPDGITVTFSHPATRESNAPDLSWPAGKFWWLLLSRACLARRCRDLSLPRWLLASSRSCSGGLSSTLLWLPSPLALCSAPRRDQIAPRCGAGRGRSPRYRCCCFTCQNNDPGCRRLRPSWWDLAGVRVSLRHLEVAARCGRLQTTWVRRCQRSRFPGIVVTCVRIGLLRAGEDLGRSFGPSPAPAWDWRCLSPS